MARIVRDDFDFKVKKENGELEYVTTYMVESEGVEQRRGVVILPHSVSNEQALPQFSEQEETQIFNFIKNVVKPKINEYEGLQ